jgi:hypothetical protein
MKHIFGLRESSQGQNVSECLFRIPSVFATMSNKCKNGSIQGGIIEDTIECAEGGEGLIQVMH